jgi:hypothetical protein
MGWTDVDEVRSVAIEEDENETLSLVIALLHRRCVDDERAGGKP